MITLGLKIKRWRSLRTSAVVAAIGDNALAPQIWIFCAGIVFSALSHSTFWAPSVYAVLLSAILTLISLFDFKYRIIPNCQAGALACVGALALLSVGGQDALLRVTAAALAMGFLSIVMHGYARLRGRHGLGWGDVKLVGAGSLWIDPVYLGPWLLLATLSAVASLAFMRWQGATISRETSIPFGPHLACGLWIVWLAQNSQF